MKAPARGAPADPPRDDDEEVATPAASRSTRSSSTAKRATRSKKKSELRKLNLGVGLRIDGDGSGGGAAGGRKNKKITFDSDEEDDMAAAADQEVLNSAAAKADGGGGDYSGDDDDDEAIEEVESGAAKADALRQMKAERDQQKKQAAGKKKKNRSAKRKAEEEAEEVVPPSDDEETPEDRGSDDDLDEEFLAMVDSERQTELHLQKLRKKAEKKRRKLQAEKKIGRHTTFVSDDGDGALVGEDAIGQSIQADHGIDVVVLPTVRRSGGGGGSDDDSDESGSEDEGYGRVDVSAVLGTKPSKAAVLFSRGRVECGDLSRKGNKKVRRSKKGGSKGSRGGKDQGWTRSRKATNLSVARGRIGGPAAKFAINKRKKLAC
jgi:nucleotide-binding universal stress UspA family protein